MMLQLMNDGMIDFSSLITHVYPFSEATAAYEMLQQALCLVPRAGLAGRLVAGMRPSLQFPPSLRFLE